MTGPFAQFNCRDRALGVQSGELEELVAGLKKLGARKSGAFSAGLTALGIFNGLQVLVL